MKKKSVVSGWKSVAGVCLLVCGLWGSAVAADKGICDGIDKDFINKHAPFLFSDVIEKAPVEGQNLCMVIISMQGNNVAMYVPASKDMIIAGEIFRNKDAYSAPLISALGQMDFKKYESTLAEAVAVTYKPKGTIRGFIYMVTDPDCPYCERAKEPVKRFADENGVEVRVIFYPLPMHPDAQNKAIKGICGKMTYEDYMKSNYSGDLCSAGTDKINKSLDVVRKLSIGGTPTFLGSKGQKVPGFAPQQFKNLI